MLTILVVDDNRSSSNCIQEGTHFGRDIELSLPAMARRVCALLQHQARCHPTRYAVAEIGWRGSSSRLESMTLDRDYSRYCPERFAHE